MARKEGLRPIGDSVKKIIEKIQKERRERLKKGKPIRTQPKLPGLKKGGAVEPEYSIKQEVKDRLKKENPKTSFLMFGLSPVTQYRKYKHRQNIKKERARDQAKTKMMSGGMAGLFGKRKNAEAGETKPKESNEAKKKKRLEELKKEIDGMKKGGDVKSPKPGTYEYYLLNRPKHSPAPIKPQKMDKGGKVKKPIKVKKIAIGIGKAKDYPGIKKIIEMNKKGKKRFAEGGMIPKTPKQKKFAALAEPRDKITYADKIAGATGKSKKMKQGGMARGGGAAIRGNNFKGVY